MVSIPMGIKKINIILGLLLAFSFAGLMPDTANAGKRKCKSSLKSKYKKSAKKSNTIDIPFETKKSLSPKVFSILQRTYNAPKSVSVALKKVSRSYYKKGYQLKVEDVLFLETLINQNINKFSAMELSKVFLFYTEMNYVPSQKLYKKLITRMEQQIHLLESKELSFLIFSLSKLGITPSENFLNQWFRTAKSKIIRFNKADIVISIYAFGLQGLLSHQKTKAFFERVPALFKNSTPSENRTLGLVANYFRYVLDKPNVNLKQFDHPIVVDAPTRSSNLEHMFGKLLRRKGKKYQKEYITELGTSVDFYTEHDNTIYQVDGPTHFIFNTEGLPRRQRQKDIFIDEIHEALGYRVIRKAYDHIQNEDFHL